MDKMVHNPQPYEGGGADGEAIKLNTRALIIDNNHKSAKILYDSHDKRTRELEEVMRSIYYAEGKEEKESKIDVLQIDETQEEEKGKEEEEEEGEGKGEEEEEETEEETEEGEETEEEEEE